jgi:hypothetical protein
MEEKEVKAPIQDVYVTLLFYMFSCNLFLTLGAIFLASIPYYNYFGITLTKEGFLISGCCFIVLYIAFFLSMAFKQIKVSMFFGAVWWISFAFFIGFFSAMIYNIALIQWLLISWAQSVAMIAYIRSIKIEWYTTLFILSFTSTLVWIVSIYGFVIENDWIMGGIIASMSALLIVYNMWQLGNVKGKFDLSWDQSVMVCMQYYCPF